MKMHDMQEWVHCTLGESGDGARARRGPSVEPRTRSRRPHESRALLALQSPEGGAKNGARAPPRRDVAGSWRQLEKTQLRMPYQPTTFAPLYTILCPHYNMHCTLGQFCDDARACRRPSVERCSRSRRPCDSQVLLAPQ